MEKLRLNLLSLLFLLGAFSTHAQLTVTFDIVEPCLGLPTGMVTALPQGGQPPYSYLWNTGATNPTINDLSAGTYSVTVSDNNNTRVTGSVVVVNDNLGVELEADVCGDTVSITTLVTDGEGPFWFDWSNGDSTATITVTSSGTYCITLLDNNKCAVQECITITINPLSVAVQADTISCTGEADGQLIAVGSGGTLPYTYLWSNGATTDTIKNLTPGSYRVTLTDANGCTAEATGVVADQPPIVINTTSVGPTCPGDSNGTITTNVSGGKPPYTYLWSNGAITANLNGLTEGNYFLTVSDANGCQATAEINLTPRSRLRTGALGERETCPGANDGRAIANPSLGVGPYTYRWSNGGTTQTIEGLAPGAYQVTVTDQLGCTAEGSATVGAAPAFTIEVNVEDVSSCEENNGAVEVTVVAAVQPVTYLWSNGANGSRIENLSPGSYSVTVTNGDDCVQAFRVTVEEPNPIAVDIQIGGTVCPGDSTGLAEAMVTGGTAPFSFRWNVDSTTQTISRLPAGTYSVTVTDAFNCSAEATAVVEESAPIEISIEATEIVCGAGNRGNASVAVSGGTPPFKYTWSTGSDQESVENLPTGTYEVTVEDANRCAAIGEVTILVVEDLTVSIVPRHVLCNGENSGSALANASGGTGPYTYAWSNGDTDAEAEGLVAGNYSVTITDVNGCQFVENVTINEPLALEARGEGVDPTCAGEANGWVSLVVAGGTMPYSFQWSTGAATDTVANLGGGTYGFTVTDANLCTATGSVTLGEPDAIVLQTTSKNITCPGGSDGEAGVIISGGEAPYRIVWSNAGTDAQLSSLQAGAFGVTVTDASGCTATATVTLTEPPAIQLLAEVLQDVCVGEATGAARATADGGNGAFTFAWSNGASGPTLTDVPAGTYTVTATDAKGCKADATVVITGFENPQCTVTVLSDVTDTNRPNGMAEVTVTGGKAPYTYLWSDGQTTARAENLPAGTVSVTVTDANGCTTTCTATIKAMAGLGDYVWEDLDRDGSQDAEEPGVEGIKVKLKNAAGQVIDSTLTDAGGKYAFVGLEAGTYSVMFVLPAGFEYTTLNNAGDDTADSDADPAMDGMTATVTLTEGEFNPTLDAGIVLIPQFFIDGGCVCLNNATTEDNGQFDQTLVIRSYPGETWRLTTAANMFSTSSPAPPAVPVPLPTGVTMTETGPGEYQFVFRIVDDQMFSAVFSNGTKEVRFQNLCAYPTLNLDLPAAELCTLDDIFRISALPSVPGVVIFKINGEVVTEIDPAYWGVGNFELEATLIPNDAEECTATVVRTITINDDCLAYVGDFVWFDVNKNGIQDPGETGIPGVKVIITSVDEDEPAYTDTTFTGVDGKYLFRVPPGTYKITFLQPADLIPTTLNAGTDDARDSDADPVMGMTDIFVLDEGEIDLTWDAGFYSPCENVTDPGKIGYDQMVCGPGVDPEPFVSIRDASGGEGPIEYLWMKSTIEGPFNPGSWEFIPDSNTPAYDPGPVYETTYFARCARREDCITFFETNIVVVKVGDDAVAEVVGPNLVCKGQTVTYSARPAGPGAQYSWEIERIFPLGSGTGPTFTYTFSSAGIYYITLYVTENNCTSSQRFRLVVTTSPSVCGSGFVIAASADEAQSLVTVQWQMRPDVLQQTYTVEYAVDGVNFEPVAQITEPKVAGNEFNNFEFVHQPPKKGWNHYRVKMVDGLGNILYSQVAEVALYTNSRLIVAYPNPVKNELTLELLDNQNESITIEVFNLNGNKIKTIPVADESKVENIDFSSLPPGNYFVRVRYGEADLKMIRIVKQE